MDFFSARSEVELCRSLSIISNLTADILIPNNNQQKYCTAKWHSWHSWHKVRIHYGINPMQQEKWFSSFSPRHETSHANPHPDSRKKWINIQSRFRYSLLLWWWPPWSWPPPVLRSVAISRPNLPTKLCQVPSNVFLWSTLKINPLYWPSCTNTLDSWQRMSEDCCPTIMPLLILLNQIIFAKSEVTNSIATEMAMSISMLPVWSICWKQR